MVDIPAGLKLETPEVSEFKEWTEGRSMQSPSEDQTVMFNIRDRKPNGTRGFKITVRKWCSRLYLSTLTVIRCLRWERVAGSLAMTVSAYGHKYRSIHQCMVQAGADTEPSIVSLWVHPCSHLILQSGGRSSFQGLFQKLLIKDFPSIGWKIPTCRLTGTFRQSVSIFQPVAICPLGRSITAFGKRERLLAHDKEICQPQSFQAGSHASQFWTNLTGVAAHLLCR